MARCRVSFSDSDRIGHAVEVDADSLYEAVALAVAELREDPLLRDPPGPMTEFTRDRPARPDRTQNPASSGGEVGRADNTPGAGGNCEAAEGADAAGR
jgi:hypothetical protein